MPRSTTGTLVLLLGALSAAGAFAANKVTVTRADAFATTKLTTVAVVTAECHEVVDCSRIQQKVIAGFGKKHGFTFVPDYKVRKALIDLGYTEYDRSLRAELAQSLGVDGFFELVVPHAERADGFGGREGSQVKLEMTVLGANGELLAHGVGTGRPQNVVTGPERVAGNIAEQIGRLLFQ